MKNQWILLIVCAALLLTCTKSPQQAGTMSETDTAMIYNPDNTPAVGAVVKFFVATDSTRTIAFQSTTDTSGHYSVRGLTKGSYNMLATKDSLIVFQDSVVALTDTVMVQPDTLQKSGSVIGTIGLQPNHDPRTVTVEVLGTDLYSNVDKDGRFTLSPIARGNYNLRLVTTLPDYTPTYKTIYTQGQKKDTLTDTLWMLYTGIPVVTSLAAWYDTVNGLVHLSWNNADYRDFQKFLIFRDPYDSIVLSTNPVAASADTFFVDTVFRRNVVTGKFSFGDTNDYHFQYRVCIQNNSARRGDTYKFVDIVAASPRRVETTFAFTYFHVAKQFMSDSASINDTLLCYVNLNNPTRQLKGMVWSDGPSGKTIRTTALDSTEKASSDTLKCVWNTAGVKSLTCIVTDMAGTTWKDTAFITVVKNPQVITMTYSPALIAVGDAIHLHMSTVDKYASVAKVEWDVGNTGQFSMGARKDSVIDTILVAPGMPNSEYLCIVQVTDDDGNVVLDTLGINVNMFKLVKDSAAFDIREGHSSVVFNNRMWVIAGIASTAGIFSASDSWFSEDGISWLPATQQASFQSRSFHTSVVFDDKIWVIGGDHMATMLNDVWFSSDGSSWIQSTPSAQFTPRAGHTSVVFNNKIWVIGGSTSDVWSSSDGITWTLATANAGFSPRGRHSSLVFDNKMWVIAGIDDSGPKSDVWNSSDGVTWVQVTNNAGFSPRFGHSSVLFDNKMWVIGGEDYSELKSDVWFSADGIAWTQATSQDGFLPRSYHSSIVYNNKMWVIAGYSGHSGTFFYIDSDVWYSGFSGK